MVHYGTGEIPLMAAEPSRSRSDEYGLLDIVHVDAQPPFMLTQYVRGKLCAGYFFAGIAVGPHNAER
jgi:hypothetical protein